MRRRPANGASPGCPCSLRSSVRTAGFEPSAQDFSGAGFLSGRDDRFKVDGRVSGGFRRERAIMTGCARRRHLQRLGLTQSSASFVAALSARLTSTRAGKNGSQAGTGGTLMSDSSASCNSSASRTTGHASAVTWAMASGSSSAIRAFPRNPCAQCAATGQREPGAPPAVRRPGTHTDWRSGFRARTAWPPACRWRWCESPHYGYLRARRSGRPDPWLHGGSCGWFRGLADGRGCAAVR